MRQLKDLGLIIAYELHGFRCIYKQITRPIGSYRFLADARRLNVALSRAKDRIIIVGNIEYARKNTLLSDIMKYCTINKR